VRGSGTDSFSFGGGQTIASVVIPSAEPVVDLMLKSFTKTLIEDEIQARVDGSIGMRPKIEREDQRGRKTAVCLEVKSHQKVIDVRGKPTNGKNANYGGKHDNDFPLLLFDTLMVVVDVLTRQFSFPQMQHDFGIKNGHCKKRDQV